MEQKPLDSLRCVVERITLPEEKKTAEVKAMIDTYGKRVDFVDFNSLDPIIREIGYETAK